MSTVENVKEGYVNGSNILLYIGGKAIGSCTSHTAEFSTSTKVRAVKPVASETANAGKFKRKAVDELSYTLTGEGLRFYDETECGYKDLLGYWKQGKPVTVKCMERGSSTPYLEGDCVITRLQETAPAGDDATYGVTLENDGAPTTLDESAITVNEPDA